MYGPPMGYPQPNGGYPPPPYGMYAPPPPGYPPPPAYPPPYGYNYGYGRPVMPMNYYGPMMRPMMPPPMMAQGPMLAPQPVPAPPPVVSGDGSSSATATPAPSEAPPVSSVNRPLAPLPSSPVASGPETVPSSPSPVLPPVMASPAPESCSSCGGGAILKEHAGCCCNNCCNTCDFEVGGEAYILRPYFHSNPIFFVSQSSGQFVIDPPATFQASAPDFAWNYTVSPAIWAEYTTPCGIGIRGRYFRFDQDSQDAGLTIPANNPGAVIVGSAAVPDGRFGTPPFALFSAPSFGNSLGFPDQISASSRLFLETIDLEAIYTFHPCCWCLTLSAGARYLNTEQDYAISDLCLCNMASPLTASVQYRHTFAGAGPLVGLEATRRICSTGLSFYGKVDGALLVGTGTEQWNFQASASFEGPGAPAVVAQASTSHNPIMPILDIELGLDYTFNRSGKIRPFVRAAVVDQTYFDAGSASSRDGNLSLFGGQVSGGIAF
jgi:hypothetical protein